jgi:purine-binding chemotaxis protein CheW
VAREDGAGKEDAGRSESTRAVAFFDVGGRRCALPAAVIQEVLLLPELSRPPGMPSFLEGVMNLGGTAVPVLRLDRLFGLPEREANLYTPLILLRDRQPAVALMVDRVLGVAAVEGGREAGTEAGDGLFAECVAALMGEGEEATFLLDAGRILAAEERERLAVFQAKARERLAEWEGGRE